MIVIALDFTILFLHKMSLLPLFEKSLFAEYFHQERNNDLVIDPEEVNEDNCNLIASHDDPASEQIFLQFFSTHIFFQPGSVLSAAVKRRLGFLLELLASHLEDEDSEDDGGRERHGSLGHSQQPTDWQLEGVQGICRGLKLETCLLCPLWKLVGGK